MLDRVAAAEVRKLAAAEALGFDDALERWLGTAEGIWAFSEYRAISDALASMDKGPADEGAWLQ